MNEGVRYEEVGREELKKDGDYEDGDEEDMEKWLADVRFSVSRAFLFPRWRLAINVDKDDQRTDRPARKRMAWHGLAGHGKSKLGKARQGKGEAPQAKTGDSKRLPTATVLSCLLPRTSRTLAGKKKIRRELEDDPTSSTALQGDRDQGPFCREGPLSTANSPVSSLQLHFAGRKIQDFSAQLSPATTSPRPAVTPASGQSRAIGADRITSHP
ncbi:hypothetical protein G7Y89_g2437 [Cudoniella acicularis]|uniref:Uncharacterized protein n=1 Tax=Cudoniella acicularis TaxID=354080 RepID=A0A8H4W6I4_9HELO|nr:hypothetical protein G7Y89_g2437 [Cudoniella acicularis]